MIIRTTRTIRLAHTFGIAALASLAVPLLAGSPAKAQTYTLNTLANQSTSTTVYANLGVTIGSNGNLYGTTYFGGTGSDSSNPYSGQGAVFTIANTGTASNPAYGNTQTPVYSFNGTDGQYPTSSVTFDSNGNMYGTTSYGGTYNSGTIFEISNSGTASNPIYSSNNFATLFSFNGTNGSELINSITLDSHGNLFGTSTYGGTYSTQYSQGAGTVFELANTGSLVAPTYGSLNTLATFNGANGANPFGNLAIDANGNLYGTTNDGGDTTLNSGYGYGTVFKITNSGTSANPAYTSGTSLNTIAQFNATTGQGIFGGVVIGADGTLYGSTFNGGDLTQNNGFGYGSVYKITNSGTSANPVYTLSTVADAEISTGGNLLGGLTVDASGNLYGTAESGGTGNGGTVYKIAAGTNTMTAIANFNGTTTGANPQGTLSIDSNGNIFGETSEGVGGGSNTTIFELTPNSRPNFIWNGGGVNNNWNTAANWVGTVAPGPAANDDITFDGTTRLAPNLEQVYSVDGVTFATTAGAFTLGGSALTIGSGGITQSSATNLQKIATSGLVLGQSQVWNVAAGGLTISAPISGNGSLTTTGAGAITLTGSNIYSGGTTVNSGTLNVGDSSGDSSSLGTGSVSVNNSSTLNYKGASSAGAATVYVNDTATVNFLNTATAGTSTIVNNGSASYLNFNGSSTAGNATIYNDSLSGYLQFGQSATAGNATIYSTGAILVDGVATLGNAHISLSGPNGGIAFDVASPGATIVSNGGSAVTNGGVDVSQGSTTNVSLGSLSGSGNVHLGAHTLTLGALGANDEISGIVEDGGGGGGGGGTGGNLIKVGTGTLTLSGANAYTGTTTIDAGTLIVTSSAAAYGTIISNATGATVDIDAGTVAYARALNNGVVNLNGGSITLADASTGGVVNVFGGAMLASAVVGDPAAINIYGGQFSSSIDNEDPTQSEVNIFGSNFSLTDPTIDGNNVDWTLTGLLSDGETLNTKYVEEGNDTASAQGIDFNPVASAAAPEPGSLALMLTTLSGIATGFLRRQRKA